MLQKTLLPLVRLLARVCFLGVLLGAFAALLARSFVLRPARQPVVYSHRETAAVQVPLLRATGTVNINTASIPALIAIPGIGKTLAAQIVHYRQQNGPFRYPEDLLRISGIGTAKLNTLLPYICLGDAP